MRRLLLGFLFALSCTKPQLVDHARNDDMHDAGLPQDDSGLDAATAEAGPSGDPDEDAQVGNPCAALDCDPRALCEVSGDGPHCVCPDNFVAVPSISPRLRCEDIDECQQGSACNVGARCVNTLGGHYCTCDEGQVIDAQGNCVDTGSCVDGEADTIELSSWGKGRITATTSRCKWECPCEASQFCSCSVVTPIGEKPVLTLHPDPYTYHDDSGCEPGEAPGACALRVRGAGFHPAHNVAFVTRDTYPGDFGGLEGADELCAELAMAATLPGDKWLAILDDGLTGGRRRFEHARGFLRADGLPFIDDLATYDYLELVYPLELDQWGQRIEGEIRAWTGAYSNNTNVTCKGWTSSAAGEEGNTGDPHDIGLLSEDAGLDSCATPHHLYCASSNLVAPFARVEFPGRLAFVTPSGFVPGGAVGKGLERADAACQREGCRLGLTGIDDAKRCAETPGTYRIFRAMLSTTEVAASSRVPERDEPWVDITRHPLTRTGADLALGLTLTGFRDPGFKPLIAGRDFAYVGFTNTPAELAEPGADCSGWTQAGIEAAASMYLWKSGTESVPLDCMRPFPIVCLEE